MHDLETESLWSQISGECIQGKMEGAKLTLFNSSHTTYAEFSKMYPKGVLLKKEEKGQAESHYGSYFADSERLGIFGRLNNFESYPAKEKVFGLRLPNKNIAISKKYLEAKEVYGSNDPDYEFIITYDKESNTVAAFHFYKQSKFIKLNDGKLTFDKNTWDAFTGKLVSGNRQDLKPIPVITAFWFAWASFFPETELIK